MNIIIFSFLFFLTQSNSVLYFSVKSIGSPTLILNTGITNTAATDSCNKLFKVL